MEKANAESYQRSYGGNECVWIRESEAEKKAWDGRFLRREKRRCCFSSVYDRESVKDLRLVTR